MTSFGTRFQAGTWLRALIATVLMALLAACGGGGGSAGATSGGGSGSGTGGTTTSPNGTIAVTLADATGAANNQISGTSVLTAKAIVTGSTGAPAANVVVTFTLDSGIGQLSPTSGTVLTDSNGVANINLKAASGGGTGAGTLTASAAPVVGTTIKAAATYAVTAASATPAAINFTTAVPSDKSIVIKGSGGNGRTESALLTFQVVDNTNSGIPNVKVDFSLPTTTSVTLGATAATTDANGNAVVAVNSGTVPTVVRVVATVDGTAISALSDTLTVTTGQPTQTALSVAAAKPDIEGWNYDGETNSITVSMADQFGGVVANGTPAVFTTNAGAIIGDGGTTATARCLTVNGQCSVNWRSETPRASVVTVVVTAANSTQALSGSVSFVNSGSYATFTALPTVDFTSSCNPQTVFVTATDQNGYILPKSSAVTIENPMNTTIVPYPTTIPAPAGTSPSGTQIQLIITPPSNCKVGGPATSLGPVLVITTPKGTRSTKLINITFPSS